MRVAVTGAAGYVGGRLVETLTALDADVLALVSTRRPWLATRQVEVDLRGPAGALVTALDGCDAVVHLAGPNEVASAREPDDALAATATAARRVAEATSRAGLSRVMYVSTVHVYGAALAEGATVSEETVPEPRAPYAVARLTAEHVLAATVDGPDLVVLRLTNSLGRPAHPSVDRWSLVANDLARQAAVGGRLELRTHGLQWRDFVPLADVCDVLAGALDRDRLPPGTYNLGSGVPMTVRQLAEVVRDAAEVQTGARPPLVAPSPPSSAPAPYQVSVDLLAKHGLRAGDDVRAAVAELVGFCLAHKEALG